MKKYIITSFIGLSFFASAQDVLVTKSSKVHFFSKTPMENIEAKSTKSTVALNKKTGSLVINIPLLSFKFDQTLMEEHFNENYMETEKFPNATFKGKITNLSEINFEKDGEYKAVLTGDLTMHGVTKNRTIDAIITVKKGMVSGSTKFKVALDDHKIERPQIVFAKIADQIDVDAVFEFIPYVKK